LTQARFIPDPFQEGERLYRSGDRARYRCDGVLELIDRIDHQVKIRGHRVETEEVEALLGSCPGVREIAVVPREVSPGDVRLVAYVAADGEPDINAWRVQLRRHLPEYMLPWRFVRLATLPLTPSGKLDRLALATAHSGPMQTKMADDDRPRTPMESAVSELCAEVFDVAHVGIHDDFFSDLGGHSLLATRLISRIRDRFGSELPLRRVFEEPTVAGIVRALASVQEHTRAQEPTIRRVPRHRQQVQISAAGVIAQTTRDAD
jgi:acyl carrier protein